MQTQQLVDAVGITRGLAELAQKEAAGYVEHGRLPVCEPLGPLEEWEGVVVPVDDSVA